MPAAPSLEALFNTQHVFEDAFAAYLLANGVTAYTSRTATDLPDSRVEVNYEAGPAAGHQATRTTSKTGWPEEDWFSGVIRFTVHTERAKDTASPDAAIPKSHDYLVARMKVLMLRGCINGTRGGVTGMASLPYHRITVSGFTGQVSAVADDAYDITELAYAIQTQILPDAWPEQPAP